MLNIYKSERFQTEYKQYLEKINKLSNGPLKEELEELLTQLVKAVKAVDHQHAELSLVARVSNDLVEARQHISNLRKKLSQKLT